MFSGNFSNQGQTMQPTGMQGQQPMGTSALFSNPQPNMVSILQKFIFRIKNIWLRFRIGYATKWSRTI